MFPMYFISILAILVIILFESNFEAKESVFTILKSTLSWLFFTINGSNEINGFKSTYLIDAGVTWTLPYEWMFYFLLPILALAFKLKVNLKIIISFTCIFILIAFLNKARFVPFLPFICGVLSAILIHKYNFREYLKKNIFSLIGIILLGGSIIFTHQGNKPIPILISTFFFIVIASGNTFFGILSHNFSRRLGQITYSIYLIHGIVLFLVFNYLVGYERASKLTEIEHWGLISLCIFPIILISQLTFKYIELPFINFKLKK
jgi:peptidoglycan/LPS O-acetylase OafA/YrhL